MMRGLSAVLALLLSVAFLALDPAKTLNPALLQFLLPLTVAAAGILAMVGSGGLLLEKTVPALLYRPGGWLLALGLGMGLGASGMGLLGALGLLGLPGSLGLLLILMAAWLGRPRIPFPTVQASDLAVAVIFLGPGLLLALAPPTDADELYYHLQLPKRMIETGHFLGGFSQPDGSRPLPVHLIFAQLYALGGETAPRLWCWLLTAAMILGFRERLNERWGAGRGMLPVLALLGSWSFGRESGIACNNLPVLLWVALATEAFLDRSWGLLGLLSGLALSAKYTAAAPIGALLCVGALTCLQEQGFVGFRRQLPWVLAGLILPVLPWPLRNLSSGLHPFFPYAGWPEASGMVFMYPEKYGLGRDFWAMLMLPWNVLMRAEIDSFVFLGRLSLVWGGLALMGLSQLKNRDIRLLAICLSLGFVGWAAGSHWIRYLLPLLGIAVIAAGALPPRWPLWLLWSVSLPANLFPIWRSALEGTSVVLGQETRDAFLEKTVPAWPAIAYLRDSVPPEATVALLYAWQGYLIPQATRYGSLEDHVPTRFLLYQHPDDLLKWLHETGITYLLVGEHPYLRKQFAFLPESVWKRDFLQPEHALETQLLKDARRLFSQKGYGVWQIDLSSPQNP